MSLGDILKEINRVKPLAEENVEEGPLETMTARRGRKNQSIESLKRLKQQYLTDLTRTAAFIVVIGDKRNEFTEIATQNYKCFSTDPDSFYSDVANKVPQELYLGKEGMQNVFNVLGRYIEDKMLEFENITGYPQLIFRQEYSRVVRTKQEFLELIKEAMVKQIGGEMVGIQSIKNIVNTAIEQSHSAQFTPIILPYANEKFALTVAKDLERISNRVFVVTAGTTEQSINTDLYKTSVSEPTNESVKKALKKISDKLKNNK